MRSLSSRPTVRGCADGRKKNRWLEYSCSKCEWIKSKCRATKRKLLIGRGDRERDSCLSWEIGKKREKKSCRECLLWRSGVVNKINDLNDDHLANHDVFYGKSDRLPASRWMPLQSHCMTMAAAVLISLTTKSQPTPNTAHLRTYDVMLVQHLANFFQQTNEREKKQRNGLPRSSPKSMPFGILIVHKQKLGDTSFFTCSLFCWVCLISTSFHLAHKTTSVHLILINWISNAKHTHFRCEKPQAQQTLVKNCVRSVCEMRRLAGKDKERM